MQGVETSEWVLEGWKFVGESEETHGGREQWRSTGGNGRMGLSFSKADQFGEATRRNTAAAVN